MLAALLPATSLAFPRAQYASSMQEITYLATKDLSLADFPVATPLLAAALVSKVTLTAEAAKDLVKRLGDSSASYAKYACLGRHGQDLVPKSVRKKWFDRLTKVYGKSTWSKQTKVYY